MRFGLPENAIDEICNILSRQPQIERAVIFGSRAKGTSKNGSDIDLTLHGGDDLTLAVLYRALDDLEDSFLPYTVDLSIFRDIDDPDVIRHIQRVGVPLYVREGKPGR